MHPLDLFWNLGILSKNFVVKDSYGSGGGRHSVNEFHRSWPDIHSSLHSTAWRWIALSSSVKPA